MPTLLDGELEKHDGPEPRVLTEDVQAVLLAAVRPDSDAVGDSVAKIAEDAGISTRTVYRVLQRSTDTIGLRLADALVVAAGSHISSCRLVVDGEVV